MADYINDQRMLLGSLMQGCKVINDRVHTRFPIRIGLLEMLLFELERIFADQLYLRILYQTVFAIAYYGLFRIGELALSQHAIKAKDVHLAGNKNKLLVMLYSSKTHGVESRPQQVKITSNENTLNCSKQLFFCPFRLIRTYMQMRGTYDYDEEIFFLFRDRAPLRAEHVRNTLRKLLQRLDLDPDLYDTHSWRIGRASDLLKWGYSLAQIKIWGCWRSNVVYKYIRECEL